MKFKLTNGSWDSLNDVLNESSELQAMIDAAAEEIYRDAMKNIKESGSSNADFMETALQNNAAAPGAGVGVKVRFVSLPSVGFEMKFTPLSRAVDNAKTN